MKDPNLSLMAYNLLNAATALAGILDQTIERNCIKVNFAYATELIRTMQLNAKAAADELSWIASGDADLSEIYPELKGGDR